MYVRAFFISLFFLFSLSFATESLKNKDFHPNYKKTTLNQKVQQMEALELQFPNQLNDDPMNREPMIPSTSSRDCDGLMQDECVLTDGCVWDDGACIRSDEDYEEDYQEDECRYFEFEDECLAAGCEWDGEDGCYGEDGEWNDMLDDCYYIEDIEECLIVGCEWDEEEGCFNPEDFEDEEGEDGDFECSDLGYQECLYYDFCDWISDSNEPTESGQCVDVDWDEDEDQGCADGYIEDCSEDGDCCPESWIGDGFTDCEDQAYGCDLTCYDNDGGDCGENEDGGGDGGDYECSDLGYEDCVYVDDCEWVQSNNSFEGYCDDANSDDGGSEGCDDGYVADCSGDGDCAPDYWIGDGWCDGSDQPYGYDLTCYDNDGGDCPEYEAESALILGDGVTSPGGSVEIPIYLESNQDVAGIQFTLSMSPSDWAVVSGFSTTVLEDCFEANFNNIDDSTIAIVYSLSGCVFEASDEIYEIALLSIDLFDYAEWGGSIDLYFDDLVMSGDDGVELGSQGYGSSIFIGMLGDVNSDANIDVIDAVSMINFILMFGEDPTESEFWAADINSDGILNILDVVLLVDMILED